MVDRTDRIRTEPLRGELGNGAEPTRDADVIAGYLRDASGVVGEASALFRPESEAEVAAILARAHIEKTVVTVVAAQTSTTGSSVPPTGWLLSTEKLKAQGSIDKAGLRAVCGAGTMLGAFQDGLEAEGLMYPPDPTSRRDCTLGGTVGCNASGPRSLRFGATRSWIRGMRVVLACGEVLDIKRGVHRASAGEAFEIVHSEDPGRCAFAAEADDKAPQHTRVAVPSFSLPAEIKNASGYFGGDDVDLIDLFIGSEGTLGVVTEVEVALMAKPAGCLSMMLFFADEANALKLIEQTRTGALEPGMPQPDSLEWFDRESLAIIAADISEFTIPGTARVALFVEQFIHERDGLGELALMGRWLKLLEACGALSGTPNGVQVAQTQEQREMMERVRHAVPAGVNEQVARNGMPKLGTDLAVADKHLQSMFDVYHAAADAPLTLLDASERAQLLASVGAELAEGTPVTSEMLCEAGFPERLASVVFGHVGNNHLHVNFLPKTGAGLALARAVIGHLTRFAIARGGSPSAEHGIGKIKRAALRQRTGETGFEQMLAIKLALDPRGCLGPGNLFEKDDVTRG